VTVTLHAKSFFYLLLIGWRNNQSLIRQRFGGDKIWRYFLPVFICLLTLGGK